MCYVPYVAIFYSISKNEKDINGAFMLCYVESKFYTVTVVAFSQYFSQTSHIFSCCWLLVHSIMMLTGCMICKASSCPSVCFQYLPTSTVLKWHICPNTLLFCMKSLLSEYEMSSLYSVSQRFASLGSEIIVDPTACYYYI